MDESKIPEYLSALADRETCDLSDEEINTLQNLVHEHPDYFGEYQLTIATKLCLARHVKRVCCPSQTKESIRSLLALVYQSRQASL